MLEKLFTWKQVNLETLMKLEKSLSTWKRIFKSIVSKIIILMFLSLYRFPTLLSCFQVNNVSKLCFQSDYYHFLGKV